MKKLLTLLTCIFALTGCDPEERIWWSPKGDIALVALDDNSLHIMQANGTLGPPLPNISMNPDDLLKGLCWLPDGSGFVLARECSLKSWEEVVTVIPKEEVERVEKFMPALMPLLEANNTSSVLDNVVAKLPEDHLRLVVAALTRMYQTDPARTSAVLAASPNGYKMLEDLKKKPPSFQVQQLSSFTLDGKERPLASSLVSYMASPKVSPKHDVAAFVQFDTGSESASLRIIQLKSRESMLASTGTSLAFGWSPDGRTLAFTTPLGGEDSQLQSIQRRTVLQEDGSFMKTETRTLPDGSTEQVSGPGHLAPPELLATAFMLKRSSLHYLPDGRLLFASQPMTLPHAVGNTDLESRFYTLVPETKTLASIPTEPGALPADLNSYAVSPGGVYAAIVEGGTDVVAITHLTTGETRIISPAHEGCKSRTIPAWKSDSELAFTTVVEGKPALMLWTESAGARALSPSWPTSALESWISLPEKKSDKK